MLEFPCSKAKDRREDGSTYRCKIISTRLGLAACRSARPMVTGLTGTALGLTVTLTLGLAACRSAVDSDDCRAIELISVCVVRVFTYLILKPLFNRLGSNEPYHTVPCWVTSQPSRRPPNSADPLDLQRLLVHRTIDDFAASADPASDPSAVMPPSSPRHQPPLLAAELR